MSQNRDEFVQRIVERYQAISDFSRDLQEKSIDDQITPYPFQALRVYEAVKNGTKRMLIWDTTSAGKTYTASLIKALDDEERIKQGKRQSRALVLSPESGIYTSWTEDEVNRYCAAMGLPLQRVHSLTNLSSVRNIPDDATIVASNYHKFGYKRKEENEYLREILNRIHQFDTIIFDEAHNLANPQAFRTESIEEIIRRTQGKRVILLDATPARNVLEDFGPVLHFLNPEVYPFSKYDYAANPNAISHLIATGQIYTLRREDIQKLFNLGSLRIQEPKYREMPDELADKYFDTWANSSIPLGVKIPKLRRLLISSKLSQSDRRENSLVDVVDSILKQNPEEQIITFSHLISGVSDRAVEQLSRFLPGRVTRIDGQMAKRVDERLERARKFSEGYYQASVNGIDATGEAFPMLTYDRDCSIILLQPPITPGHFDQVVGRVLRYGQIGSVNVIPILAVSERLKERMLKFKEDWEKDGKRKFVPSWLPTTIDEDEYIMGEVKARVFSDKLPKALPLDQLELIIANTNLVASPQKAEREGRKHGVLVYRSLPPKNTKQRSGNEFSDGVAAASWMYGVGSEVFILMEKDDEELRNLGLSEQFINGLRLAKTKFQRLMQGYASDEFPLSTSADTLNLIRKITESLEGKLGDSFGIIGDLGCGTACASRILQRPIVNLDISSDMIRLAKVFGRDINGNQYARGNMAQLPFRPNSFDLLIASYSLMYLSQQYNELKQKHVRELEDTFMEANRILKPERFFVFGYPNRMSQRRRALSDDEFNRVNDAAIRYGFNVLFSDLFTGTTTEKGKSKKTLPGVFLTLCQKDRDESKEYKLGQGDLSIFDYAFMSYIKVIGGMSCIDFGIPRSAKPRERLSDEYSGRNIGNLDEFLKGMEIR